MGGVISTKRHTVFGSHSHVDNALIDRYVEALRTRGFDIWYDRTNLERGRQLSAEIQSQLQARSAFVIMLTQTAVDSYWVQLETDAFRTLVAQDRARLTLPVRIGSVEVPILLRGLTWIDALNMPFEVGVDEI